MQIPCRVTDDVIDEVKSWQGRALESVYPIVFFDCLVVKVRQDKRIINKAVYIALGIDLSGHKDILGLWISDNEGAKFWLNNLTEMKNRGLLDILIACSDNLTGMSEAISAGIPRNRTSVVYRPSRAKYGTNKGDERFFYQ